MQVGYDYESKTFDIDRISLGKTTSQINKILNVLHTIIELENKVGKMIPLEEVEKELEGKMDTIEIEQAIVELKKKGDIYEPKKGYIGRM